MGLSVDFSQRVSDDSFQFDWTFNTV